MRRAKPAGPSSGLSCAGCAAGRADWVAMASPSTLERRMLAIVDAQGAKTVIFQGRSYTDTPR